MKEFYALFLDTMQRYQIQFIGFPLAFILFIFAINIPRLFPLGGWRVIAFAACVVLPVGVLVATIRYCISDTKGKG